MIIGSGQMLFGDCLDVMADIPDGSVDMILCDLPYGTTACSWDTIIPFEPLWSHYWRVAKPNAAIVLTASQPFTTTLAASQLKHFKYQWLWMKERPSNPQLAKIQPLKCHEDVLIFYRKTPGYRPQGVTAIPVERQKVKIPEANSLGHCTRKPYVQTQTNYPKANIEFASERGLHPTQKPVALFEYLIRTYTNEGETVLDNCSGSGTTAIAAMNSGRRFICIEQDVEYYYKSLDRVRSAAA